jgi:hypothetical protein
VGGTHDRYVCMDTIFPTLIIRVAQSCEAIDDLARSRRSRDPLVKSRGAVARCTYMLYNSTDGFDGFQQR